MSTTVERSTSVQLQPAIEQIQNKLQTYKPILYGSHWNRTFSWTLQEAKKRQRRTANKCAYEENNTQSIHVQPIKTLRRPTEQRHV